MPTRPHLDAKGSRQPCRDPPAWTASVEVGVLTHQNLVGRVVAVLLGVEPAPAIMAQPGVLCAQDTLRSGVSVGHVGAGYLVVAFVLAEAAVGGVDRRGRVASL